IDGLDVGDTGEIVLIDRKQLSEYGMFIIDINLSANTHRLMGNPQFVSRGFIYMKKSQELLKEIKTIIYDVHRDWMSISKKNKNYDYKELKAKMEKAASKYIYKKTEREPIIQIVVV
ncbi:MAG TPA: RNase J family beta-CASP ribonuclease, partial [Candidatus Dojkabacteria bacterium]|nr:RNase J family beta-CASP ribonuclease [Candidatus Dojkabacteria bacterium]